MGSFFNTLAKFDPVQQLAGKNSFIAKEDSYDPLMKNTSLGQAYANRHNPGDQPGAWSVAGPYAGQAPTLNAAARGYLQQSQNQANPTGSSSAYGS